MQQQCHFIHLLHTRYICIANSLNTYDRITKLQKDKNKKMWTMHIFKLCTCFVDFLKVSDFIICLIGLLTSGIII